MPVAERLGTKELAACQRELHAATDVGQLLARAAGTAPEFCGFDRALILVVEGAVLRPSGMRAVDHDASDALRLRALASDLSLVGDCEELRLMREAEDRRQARPIGPSVLVDRLELEDYVTVPVVPEQSTVALLVVDRAGAPVDDEARTRVELFAHLLALALERTVLRSRLTDVATEVRHLAVSASALTQEARSGAISALPDASWEPLFPIAGVPHSAGVPATADRLTDREHDIAQRLARGQSNREIAAALHLAPDTIKAHVARVLRKLGVSNRTEAVAVYLSITKERS